MKRVSKALAAAVRRRAKGACEYCGFLESNAELPFVIDHVRARQHRGTTALENLALACGFCNSHKGPNIAGVDPKTGRQVRLFNPRRDAWRSHFRWDGLTIVGVTAIGRATVSVLALNHREQLARRRTTGSPSHKRRS
jgi:hypothetical protein